MKRLIIILSAILTGLYLAASFTFLSFHPDQWNIYGRAIFAGCLVYSWAWVIDQYKG